ncbi:MAG: bicyclomycin resistance protein [Comamonadaceae bacterium PBBC2]|nr:MAG: bicyclomycin resistance protein [Comamonadaceae bacterium PBBC2]
MKVNKIYATLVALTVAAASVGAADKPATAEKVMRYAFRVAETGFDPAKVSDIYSRTVTEAIFEGLYGYDFLARPAVVRPLVADGMPVASSDFRTYTVKIKPGILFADDPAFCDANGQNCKKRELTAQDFVYSYKRLYDPKNKSPVFSDLEELRVLGMDTLRKAAEKPGAKFDYDTEVEGLRALDRYTIQFKLAETRPRFIYQLADSSVYGAVAREVIEKYGDKTMEHPVGTGPYKLDKWTRSSSMSFVKNPNYREVYYDEKAGPNDPEAAAVEKLMKGRRMPMLDRIEVSIIEEEQPRYLAFLGKEHDFYERMNATFAYQAIPNNKLAPNLVKQGITMTRTAAPDITISYFSMANPIVGGYTPDKVALRRAIALGFNGDEEIRLPFRNQATMAQGPIQPLTYGYDEKFKSEMSEYSPAKAMALLDLYGYTDKNGDGWRDLPDGKPLVIEYATQPDGFSRERIEIWKKCMDAIGIKMVFKSSKWPENLKMARSDKLMMWGLAYSASAPDGDGALQLGFGPAKGQSNLSGFDLPAFNKLYMQQQLLPDGPERLALMQQAVKLMVAYMPVKVVSHRTMTDMSHPWFEGYVRRSIARGFWKYVDIDTSKLPKE